MRTGTYRDVNGELVHVRRTATGYTLTRADGTVTSIGAVS